MKKKKQQQHIEEYKKKTILQNCDYMNANYEQKWTIKYVTHVACTSFISEIKLSHQT